MVCVYADYESIELDTQSTTAEVLGIPGQTWKMKHGGTVYLYRKRVGRPLVLQIQTLKEWPTSFVERCRCGFVTVAAPLSGHRPFVTHRSVVSTVGAPTRG